MELLPVSFLWDKARHRLLDRGCRLDFFVDFEFHSRILQRVIEVLFHEAVRRMVAAFDHRAEHLYGRATPDVASRPAE